MYKPPASAQPPAATTGGVTAETGGGKSRDTVNNLYL